MKKHSRESPHAVAHLLFATVLGSVNPSNLRAAYDPPTTAPPQLPSAVLETNDASDGVRGTDANYWTPVAAAACCASCREVNPLFAGQPRCIHDDGTEIEVFGEAMRHERLY